MRSSFSIFVLFAVSLANTVFAQNVGIGTTAPTRAGLVVTQKAGETYGLFGTGNVTSSLTASYLNSGSYLSPAIGFNMYHNNGDKPLQFGHSGKIMFDQIEGDFYFMNSEAGPPDENINTFQRTFQVNRFGNAILQASLRIGLPFAGSGATLGALTVNNDIGGTYAIFGSNAGGLSISSQAGGFPSLGFNTYVSNGRRMISAGFGGALTMNRSTGDFTFQSLATTASTGAEVLPITRFVIDKDGEVGIGTTTPQATLHVAGALEERLRIENPAALAVNTTTSMYFRNGNFFTGAIKTIGTNTNAARLGFFTSATAASNEMSERVSITDNGMLGVGTVTPQHPLTFSNVLGDKISLWGGNTSPTLGHYGIGIANSAMQLYSAGAGDDILLGFGRSAAFTENVRFKGNGNVGIGTNNPALGGLVVNKKEGAVNALFGSNTTGVAVETDFPGIGLNTYFNAGRKFIANGFGALIGLNPSNGDVYIQNTTVTGTANAAATTSPRLLINKDGNVGIGTGSTQPTARLHVAGNVRIADGTEAANRVLVSSSNGTTSWSDADYFRASLAGVTVGNGGQNIVATFFQDANTYSSSNNLDFANNHFIAPRAGFYQFNLRVVIQCPNDSRVVIVAIEKQVGANWVRIADRYQEATDWAFSGGGTFLGNIDLHTGAFIETNQRVRVLYIIDGATIQGPNSNPADISEFSGFRVR